MSFIPYSRTRPLRGGCPPSPQRSHLTLKLHSEAAEMLHPERWREDASPWQPPRNRPHSISGPSHRRKQPRSEPQALYPMFDEAVRVHRGRPQRASQSRSRDRVDYSLNAQACRLCLQCCNLEVLVIWRFLAGGRGPTLSERVAMIRSSDDSKPPPRIDNMCPITRANSDARVL